MIRGTRSSDVTLQWDQASASRSIRTTIALGLRSRLALSLVRGTRR